MNDRLKEAIDRWRKRDWLPSDGATMSWPQYEFSRKAIEDAFVIAKWYVEHLDAELSDA